MSRVHDALRKATQETSEPRRSGRVNSVAPRNENLARAEMPPPPPPLVSNSFAADEQYTATRVMVAPLPNYPVEQPESDDLESIILNARSIEYRPLRDALVVNLLRPREAPAEEFKTLRTRLNHMQSLQPLHTLVVTSASPAEGKSFTATNLAVTQAQLADKRVLLADFDFRRPTVHNLFQMPCCPGITDYLTGKARLSDVMCRVGDTNLYVLPAGEAVPNPLELLNLKECKSLIGELRNHFDWVILDSPPLLFAADGNLLSTMCDGTILVVRIGTTTFESVTRALQSLCENNVLGVVVNGARRGELYSKYTYYHDYYYSADGKPVLHEGEPAEAVPAD